MGKEMSPAEGVEATASYFDALEDDDFDPYIYAAADNGQRIRGSFGVHVAACWGIKHAPLFCAHASFNASEGVKHFEDASRCGRDYLNGLWRSVTGESGEYYDAYRLTDIRKFLPALARAIRKTSPRGKAVSENEAAKSGGGGMIERVIEKPCTCPGAENEHGPGCLLSPTKEERDAAASEISMMAGKARETIENMSEVAARWDGGRGVYDGMLPAAIGALTALELALCVRIRAGGKDDLDGVQAGAESQAEAQAMIISSARTINNKGETP